ncbi:GntR family transcriptional regulator [Photobacterium sanctipauli]|uniref:GntR family transcriptional regulator n=1 Tax=Photobacterium sanctipauli TaxID=1342794 RepID=A0A2T3NPC8_9GAMM|nr:GntR family transcriptional regulator [Photobacterium sanctipauli]PSW18072.1 GntR family transcriptional regulator [Photobacterium sanctipauli]
MEQQLLSQVKDKLDFDSSVPLYIQLKQGIEQAIVDKLLVHGSMLPSERKLSLALGVSRVTVVKALAELLEQGMVVKKQGKGTMVNLPIHYNLSGGGFSAQLQQQGAVANRWLVRELVACNDELGLHLATESGETIAKIKRVRLADDVPVSIETMYIPEQFLPRPDLLEGSLYAYWREQGIEPHTQDYSLSVYEPTEEEARMLEIPHGLPLMKIILKSVDKAGRVLEYGSAICRSDYYKFDFKVQVGN